jgi:hypothetical protein
MKKRRLEGKTNLTVLADLIYKAFWTVTSGTSSGQDSTSWSCRIVHAAWKAYFERSQSVIKWRMRGTSFHRRQFNLPKCWWGANYRIRLTTVLIDLFTK